MKTWTKTGVRRVLEIENSNDSLFFGLNDLRSEWADSQYQYDHYYSILTSEIGFYDADVDQS